jgi:hypothetical protein
MTAIWFWVLVGVGGLFAASLAVGIAVAAILANIGREYSRLAESEPWASSPLLRARDPVPRPATEHVSGRGHGHSSPRV